MARVIETPGGTLRGTVDRLHRRVVWALACPDCPLEIPLNADTFNGRKPATCECGWKAAPVGRSFPDEPATFFDYAASFETIPAQAAG